jgi:uncharacterized protein
MNTAIEVVVDDLYIHPIKSCAPVRVDSLAFDQGGLVLGDREWVIVDEQSNVVWQGSHARLALVHPTLHDGVLTLRNPEGDQVVIDQGADRRPRQVRIWNDITKQHVEYSGTDGGNAAAAFLQRTVGDRLHLVRLGHDALRREGSNRVHVVSRESYNEFASTLALNDAPVASIARFRPNVVITGLRESLVPFIEEQFAKLEWSSGMTSICLVVGDLCVRCVVPNVDPATGRVDASVSEAVSVLSAQRYPGQPTYFGIYAHSAAAGTLARGTVLTAALAF